MRAAQGLLDQIHGITSRPWTLMEVCGGQTHALLRHGIDQLLPEAISLIHGPGCPVCVTATERIDRALTLAEQPGVTLCSYGDMLRVPGSNGRDLLSLRASGADVRVVYAPLDVLDLARRHPERQVVFFAVGFETTAPATALLAQRALAEELNNLQLLVAHVRVAPVLDQLLGDPACAVQGVLAAGHVCTVMGAGELQSMVRRHQRPVVITGFSAVELLEAILQCVQQLERGEKRLENAYTKAVAAEGNQEAQRLLARVFEPIDTTWRGLGPIKGGGYRLRPPFDRLEQGALERNNPCHNVSTEADCPSGLVLQGLMRPNQCPNYGTLCTPDSPLGAPMVSSEGACAAYHRYQR